jgi:hypothetical protein
LVGCFVSTKQVDAQLVQQNADFDSGFSESTTPLEFMYFSQNQMGDMLMSLGWTFNLTDDDFEENDPLDDEFTGWVFIFRIPFWVVLPEITDRFPDDWEQSPNRKKIGYRWIDPENPKGNGVRIDRGDPNSPHVSQRVNHVIVRSNGVVLGRDGEPIDGSIQNDPENAHIPLTEYAEWKSWNEK